jgi:hypothetical protein
MPFWGALTIMKINVKDELQAKAIKLFTKRSRT